MSLASLLLKSTHSVDSELDALFKSHPSPHSSQLHNQPPSVIPTSKKRKQDHERQEIRSTRKRSKLINKSDKAHNKKPLKPTQPEEDGDGDDDDGGGGDNDSDLEATYLRGKKAKPLIPNEDPVNDEDSEDDKEGDPSKLVHESLAGKSKSKSKHGPKQKYTPPDETAPQKDQRTVFVGNLSLEVAQKRPLQKQLQRHILSFIPSAKIESIRFRSIPFSTPTTYTPPAASTSDPKSVSLLPHKNPSRREHDRSRASSWRHTKPDEEEDGASSKKDEKQYLNPHQKKKIAFIHQEFHTTADTVHAYLVFAHPIPQASRPKNLPPMDPVMDPYEAAKEAVRKADGSLFMERMIRVDFVGGQKNGQKGEGEEIEAAGEVPFNNNDAAADSKSTLFVGNLDLASKEEDLRVFFETLMKNERGEPETQGDEGSSEEEVTTKKPRTWVVRVRIIRDKDTQLGKGFGYVQFMDRECIDEILNMEPTQLKFAKRKLRVQRCKTIPGTKLPSSVKLSTNNTNVPSTKSKSEQPKPLTHRPPTPITIPKGDPTLGTKLANLSKEERKKAKASDADRIARRLAKKKARMAMNTPKDRALESGGGGGSGPEKKKKRDRVRKGAAGVIGKKPATDMRGKKGRVRSEKSLEKRNAKKK